MTPKEKTPERELGLMHLRSYLQKFPKSAYDLVFHFFEKYSDLELKYLNLADDYKRLRMDFENLQRENIKLKSLDESTSR